jgi:hypothetical protein
VGGCGLKTTRFPGDTTRKAGRLLSWQQSATRACLARKLEPTPSSSFICLAKLTRPRSRLFWGRVSAGFRPPLTAWSEPESLSAPRKAILGEFNSARDTPPWMSYPNSSTRWACSIPNYNKRWRRAGVAPVARVRSGNANSDIDPCWDKSCSLTWIIIERAGFSVLRTTETTLDFSPPGLDIFGFCLVT